jgi:hypothetical protein
MECGHSALLCVRVEDFRQLILSGYGVLDKEWPHSVRPSRAFMMNDRNQQT